MFCPTCGQQIPEGSPSCQHCGARFAATPPIGVPPAPGYGGPMPPVPDYMVWSILELLFCCLPFGIVGLIYSIQANSAKTSGRYQEALDNAEKAKKFLIYGIVGWAVCFFLYIGFIVLMIIGAAAQQ